MKKKLFLFLFALLALTMHAADVIDPQANPQAVVHAGNARFTVLTPEMIRIQYSDRQLFEDRGTFGVVNRKMPVPAFTQEINNGLLTIKTEALTLTYKIGEQFKPEALAISMVLNGKEVVWHPGIKDSLNLKGTTRTLDGNEGDRYRDRMEPGLVSRNGWSIIDESPSFKRGDGSHSFAFDKKVDGMDWWASPVDKNAIDWYFLGYGHQYRKALGDFIQVGGRIPMPPLYIFGYWYSKYQRYTAQDFMDIANEVEANRIPLDVMIFDMDWHTEGWTGWTWNREIIPDPKGLIQFMHDKKLKVGLNLHPADGVDSDEIGFKEMVDEMKMDKHTRVVPWQLQDSTFYRAMFRNILHRHESIGVDFWWLDWQQNLTSRYVDGLGETFWCNHVFYNDMKNNRLDRRPVIFHRWGGLGSHRYPIGFSGDTYTTFKTLAFEPYFTATASNVCFGYWGHDLGGHLQREGNDPELYLRWMQYGVFTPIFRTHATNWEGIERRIWKYDNFLSLRKTVELRYQLMPYIYGAARQAYDTGVSICRPLYYDYPEEGKAYSREDEYLFGDNILVAPIVARSDNGINEKDIWLPEGDWYNVCTGKLMKGNQTFTARYTLEDIPYFYKAGSVIPCYPPVMHLDRLPDTLCLQAVCGKSGESVYYEDAGNDNGYQQGEYTTQQLQLRQQGKNTTLIIKPRVGSYPGMPQKRNYSVTFLGCSQPKKVSVNGKHLAPQAWSYDAHKGTVNVSISQMSPDKEINIEVK